MRFVGDDDDVVSLSVRRAGVLVELLDQRKDVCLVLGQESAQMSSVGRSAGVAVVINYVAAGEGLVDLAVEVVAVGQH